MRTETDLREAFATLADRAPDAATVRLAPAPRPTGRRPRPWTLVAAALCLVLLAVAVPYVVLRQATAPADLRAPGYWGLISRVDPPLGWVVAEHGIFNGSEYVRLGPSEAEQRVCDVTVYGRGRLPGPVPAGDPVRVGDRAGVYVRGSDVEPSRLVWTYADDAWAAVSCLSESETQNRAWSVDLAPRLTIAPGALRLPFRLTALPAGYAVRNVVTTTVDGAEVGGAILSAPGQPAITVVSSDSPFDPAGPGMPGVESLTVRGHAVTVREDKKGLAIAVGTHYVSVSGDSSGQSWAPGERDRLLEVADHLRYADDLGDPATWFDARRALP